MINNSSNRLFQMFYFSELGLVFATVLFDMFIDPLVMLIELKYEENITRNVFCLIIIVFSLICLPLVLFSYYGIDKKNKFYLILCLLTQIVFILVVSFKNIGFFLNIIPNYWNNEIWITIMHFCIQILISMICSFLIICILLNEKEF